MNILTRKLAAFGKKNKACRAFALFCILCLYAAAVILNTLEILWKALRGKSGQRLAAMVLSLCLVFNLAPTMAFADETGTPPGSSGICEHLHDEECGYIKSVEAQPCSHLDADGAYSCTPVLDSGVSGNTATPSDAEENYVCGHSDDCGYSEATEGADCTHSCELCNPSADLLPQKDDIVTDTCICDTLCTEGVMNADCPLCLAGTGDLSVCLGAEKMELTAYEQAVALFTALPDADSITTETTVEEKDELQARLDAAMTAFERLTAEDREKFTGEHNDLLEKWKALGAALAGAVSAPLIDPVPVTTLDELNAAITAADGTADSPTLITIDDAGISVDDCIYIRSRHVKLTGGTLTRADDLRLNLINLTAGDAGASLTLENIKLDGKKDTVINDNVNSIITVNSNCTLTMNTGALLQNNRTDGVRIVGTFIMTGGEISGNLKTGVDVFSDGGTFIAGGSANVTGNTKNVWLANTTMMLGTGENAPETGMKIGVSGFSGKIIVSSGASADDTQYFISDDPALEAVHENGALKLVPKTTQPTQTPTVEVQSGITYGSIYANGVEIKIVAGIFPLHTNILYDQDGDGTIGDTEYLKIGDIEPAGRGYDLTGYNVYGGMKDTAYTGSTCITMTGGRLGNIFGGGRESTAQVDGDTNITVSGGKIMASIYAGGFAGKVTGKATADISGSATIDDDVYSGGDVTAIPEGGTSITVGGGATVGFYNRHGIIINGGSAPVTTGVASFAIDPDLTGADGCISVNLPLGYTAGTIATGAVAGDLNKITLMGNGASGKEAYLDGTEIKVREKAAALTGTVTITGALNYNEQLTASVTDTNNSGTLSYQWKRGDTNIGAGAEYTIVEADIGRTLSCVVTSSAQTGSISASTGTIAKADGPAAPNISFAFDGANPIKLMGATTLMEYSLNGGTSWMDCTTDMDLRANLASITTVNGIQIRITGTNTHSDGAVKSIDITTGAAVSGVNATGCTNDSNNDGTLTGVTAAMEYKLSTAAAWTGGTGSTVTGLASGEYYVRMKAAGTALAGDTSSFTVAGYSATPTYRVTLDKSGTHTFDGATVGYSEQTPLTVTVQNTGNQPTGALTVALSDTDSGCFALGKTSISNILVNAADTFTIAPKTGLAAGKYTETVTVRGGNSISASFHVSFTVSATPVSKYTLTVTNGTGSGDYRAGAGITVTADTAPNGRRFREWTASGIALADKTQNPVTITMPADDVTLTAVYEDIPAVYYTITFHANGGSVHPANGTTNAEGKLISFPTPTRSGSYRFDGWYTAQSGGARVAADTVFIQDSTIYARWTYTGSSNGSIGGTITTSPADMPGTPAESEIKVDGKVDESGNVTAAIAESAVSDAIKKAEEVSRSNGSLSNGITLVLNVDTHNRDASSVTVNLPKTTQETIINKRIVNTVIVVNNPDIKIGMDLSAVTSIHTQAQADVNITAVRMDNRNLTGAARTAIGSRPVFDLKVNYGSGKRVADFGGGSVSVAIPYILQSGEEAGGVYAVYVDDKGNTSYLINSVYNANSKLLRFSTSHFSTYGVGYKMPAGFTDTAGHWAEDDIAFVVTRGLLGGTSSTTFNPDNGMTYGMFVAALDRLANANVSSCMQSSFTDAFDPDSIVTREQMAVIMENYSKVIGFTLPKVHAENIFADSANISSWAKDSVKATQMAGIIAGKNGNTLDPQGTATRAEASAMLRRFMELMMDASTAQGWMQNDDGQWMYYENGSLVKGRTKNQIGEIPQDLESH